MAYSCAWSVPASTADLVSTSASSDPSPWTPGRRSSSRKWRPVATSSSINSSRCTGSPRRPISSPSTTPMLLPSTADRIQALAEGRPWRDPPVVKETVGASKKKPPLSGGGKNGSFGGNGGWDNWDNDDDGGFRSSSSDMRRNQTVGDFRSSGGAGGAPTRSRSTQDIYTRSQLEDSAANKESFFSRKMAENDSRPEGVPPSQGGKYVGFGSTPAPMPRTNSQGDVLSAVTQGFGRLSMVAASAAQSAAIVVQAGTKELTSKVREGGYDHKVNETVNVVTEKTTEIGQKTWGIMKGVMALASQKVEEYTKEGINWKTDSWQQNESESNGYYQEFAQGSKGRSSSGGGQPASGQHFNSGSAGSWDDWDSKDNRKEESTKGTAPHNGDSWAGWDDAKDDGYSNFYQSASDNRAVGHNGKSDANWTGGGFV
ncbi:hypothetical protein F0562_016742 [Nyssa sinensis]|uniref:Uncharacterized protein n=1 Tax=Nyssa sinensis TaxID=561372 RepID=A0A5J4ZEM4_9ASTE|nr:hypothetical protein F0562_016742 [Nyssa sinensis]